MDAKNAFDTLLAFQGDTEASDAFNVRTAGEGAAWTLGRCLGTTLVAPTFTGVTCPFRLFVSQCIEVLKKRQWDARLFGGE